MSRGLLLVWYSGSEAVVAATGVVSTVAGRVPSAHPPHACAQKLTIRGAEIRGDGSAEHRHRHHEVGLQVVEFGGLPRLGTDGTHELCFVQLAIAVDVPSADGSVGR